MESYSRTSLDEREETRYLSNRGKKPSHSKRKLKLNPKYYDHSQFSSSLFNSYLKSPNSVADMDNIVGKGEGSLLTINHFTEKYLPRGMSIDNLYDEMKNII